MLLLQQVVQLLSTHMAMLQVELFHQEELQAFRGVRYPSKVPPNVQLICESQLFGSLL